MNQKLEDVLQLALQTPEEIRERTDDLNVGFNGSTRTWELIVKYHGSLDALEDLNIQVEYLIAGYAILTVPEQLVDRMAEVEEIEYVEKPKRFFYSAEMPTDNSCIAQVTLRDPFLTGAGVVIAVLDSGIDYRLPEFRHSDGSTRILYLWDQTLQPEEIPPAPGRNGTEAPNAGAGAADTGTVVPNAGAGVADTGTGVPNAGAGEADTGTRVSNAGAGAADAGIGVPNAGGGEAGTGTGAPNEGAGEERFVRRPPAGFTKGVEFDAPQINRALEEADPQRQYALLPSADTGGHGTAVAGIAAGNSRAYQGAAPEAELLIVKLGLPSASSFPRTTEIMRAVTYAVRKAIKLRMPIVINLSFGNTYGAHDGSSLLERFLDNASEMGRTVICVGTGNEGNSAGHLAGSLLHQADGGSAGQRSGSGALIRDGEGTSGQPGRMIARPASIELAVAEYERTLNVQLWKNYCDKYRIYLRSPGGQEAQLPEMINGGKYTLRLEQTEILVYFGEPAPYAVAEEIYVEMFPVGRGYINSGVWTIRLEPMQVVTGRYYFYLPSAVVRAGGTGFYRSTPEVTLTIPATAAKVISVGAYDSTYEAYADFSGRGYADANRTIGVVAAGLAKPDLAAPGVGIIAPDIYGGYTPMTGTSFATPIAAGSCALIMEWGEEVIIRLR